MLRSARHGLTWIDVLVILAIVVVVVGFLLPAVRSVMETRFDLGPWARGGSSTVRGFDPTGPSLQSDNPPFGGHPTGMNVAMADGSVRFLSSSIDPKRLAAAITIAGGEPVELDRASP